ncbi:MAG: hypothetical protein JWL75_190 [Parcubacteria group bacterium]|nr:hypothetical protein [Parcubacteria group bacterium]
MTQNTFLKRMGGLSIGLMVLGMFAAPFLAFAQDTPDAVPSQSITEYLDTKKPVAQDEAKWNQFITACKAAAGTPTSNYDANTAKDCLAADGKTNTKCVVATATCNVPAATTPAAGNQEGVATAPFTALTQLPQIDSATTAKTLPLFLNQLYKICIGAGAALAVIMIMIGGVQIMTSQGSVTSNEKAKSHIQNAILGLILILAPTIVFSIINPDILKLNIDVSGLQQLKSFDSGLVVGAPGQFTGADTALWEHVNGNRTTDLAACTASKGALTYGCKKKDGTTRAVSAADTCTSDEDSYSVCKPSDSAAPMSQAQCTATYGTDIKPTSINSNGNFCSVASGYVSVPHGCCIGASPTDTLCCAKPAAPPSTPAAQPAKVTPPPTK